MKKIILSVWLSCTMLAAIIAQGNREQMNEKMEAQKIAYISNKLNLNTQEAQQFWPIYNEFNNAQKDLKSQYYNGKPDLMNLSDSEASNLYDDQMEMEYKKLDLKKEYTSRMVDVIGPKKVLKLLHLEDQFKKEIIEKFKQRYNNQRRNGKNGPNGPRMGK